MQLVKPGFFLLISISNISHTDKYRQHFTIISEQNGPEISNFLWRSTRETKYVLKHARVLLQRTACVAPVSVDNRV